MRLSKESTSIKVLLIGAPIVAAMLFVFIFGKIFGIWLASMFGIDPSIAIRGQANSEPFMVALMLGFVLLIVLGCAAGCSFAALVLSRAYKCSFKTALGRYSK
jgi:hypothetical protein